MDAQDLTGQVLKGYHLLRQIGKGGFGAIYQAQHCDQDTTVAVKLLHKHLLEDKDAVERFQREARSLASLNHPNIVELFDFDWDDEFGHFMILEWLPGFSLKDYLRKKRRLSFTETYDLFEQLLAGLGDAHAQGIVHRDLKPGNLFLVPCEDGYLLKILDFGLALLSFEMMKRTQRGAVMGSSNYMSPEQSMGLSEKIDTRTDIYACGCLLSKCLTGETPLCGNAYEVAMKHYNEEPIPSLHDLYASGGFSGDLEQVYFSMVARKREQRFPSTWELYQALQNAMWPLMHEEPVPRQDNMMQTFMASNPQDFMQSMSHPSSSQSGVSTNSGSSGNEFSNSFQHHDSPSLEFELNAALRGDSSGSSLSSESGALSFSVSSGSSSEKDAFAETMMPSDLSSDVFAETYVFEGDESLPPQAHATTPDPVEAAPLVGVELKLQAPTPAVATPSSSALSAQRKGRKQNIASLREKNRVSAGFRTPSATPISQKKTSSDNLPHINDEPTSESSSISLLKRSSKPSLVEAERSGKREIKMRAARIEPERKAHPAVLLFGGAFLGVGILFLVLWSMGIV